MKKSVFLTTFLFLLLSSAAAAQPSISSLSASTLSRSGRLLIQGLGFGAEQGTSQVQIGGLNALVTRWSDTLIAAYVPESAPTGAATVRVIAGVASNTAALGVTLRQPNGRVKWRFQADSDYIYQRPAVGPDGTIVAHDSSGIVYALTPDGGLKWIFKTRVYASGPPSIGADGTVYVASSSTIDAIDSNGNPKWSFTEPQGGQGVIAGPTVGPDGNIYVVSDFAGLGAFSLSPTGLLLWFNLGSPVMSQRGQLGAEIVFGPSRAGGPLDRFYVAFDAAATDPQEHLYAFRLTGTQEWSVPLSLSKDLFMQGQQQPAVGPDGTVFETGAIPLGGNWSLNAFSPSAGSLMRGFSPSPGNGMSPPDIGADGTAYFAHSLAYLQAVSSSNALRWQFFDGSILNSPIVSPANDLVVVGGNPNFGIPGFVRGHSAANGQLLWSVNLGVENGGNQSIESRPRFTPTGNAVYFGTVVLGGSTADTYCYLYALDTGGGAAAIAPVLTSLTLTPNSVTGGAASTGQVTLSAPAAAAGAVISLSSSNTAVAGVPATVKVSAGSTGASFSVSTNAVSATAAATISATFAGVAKTAALTVASAPRVLTSLTLTPNSVTGGAASTGKVTLSAPAAAAGAVISLSSSNTAVAGVPATVTIPAGSTSASFSVSTNAVSATAAATISATFAGVAKTAALTVASAPVGDTVSIQTADYKASRRRLTVEATSTSSTATLKVYVTSTGELIGKLTNQGGGKYQGQFTRSTNPVNITVRSSLGGVAGKSVIVR